MSCASVGIGNSLVAYDKNARLKKINRVVYYNPQIYPEVEDIKLPTYEVFFSTISNELRDMEGYKIMRVETPVSYKNVDIDILKELCANNSAEIAIVPHIRYFKVGLGNLLLSNQVEVSLKLYDENGNFIMETAYDTYKANARILGSAENAVRTATAGALKKLNRELQHKNILPKSNY